MKVTGRSFTLDDDSVDTEALPEMDDFATSKPKTDEDKDE